MRSVRRSIRRIFLLLVLAASLIPRGSAMAIDRAQEESGLYRGRTLESWRRDLRSPRVELRRRTAGELKTLAPGIHELLPDLGACIDDDDEEVRRLTLESLAVLGRRYGEAIELILRALDSKKPSTRIAGMQAVKTLWLEGGISGGPGPPALPASVISAVVSLAGDEEATIRMVALHDLPVLFRHTGHPRQEPSPEARQVILAALSDEHAGVRAEATAAAMLLGKETAAPFLRRALEDPEANVRHRAALVLAGIDPRPGENLRILAEALTNGETGIRDRAASAIRYYFETHRGYGPEAAAEREALVPALIAALDDERSLVRIPVLAVLEKIGPEASDAVEPLMHLLSRSRDRDEGWIVGALGAIGPAAVRALPTMIDAASSRQSGLMRITRMTLKKLGPDAAESALRAFVDPLRDGKTSRLRAIDLLLEFGPETAALAAGELLNALPGAGDEVKFAVAGALGLLGPGTPGTVSGLIALLEDPAAGVRLSAVAALKGMGPGAAAASEALKKAALDPVPMVRREASAALAALIPPEDDSLPAIITMLESGDPASRDRALEVLSRMREAGADALSSLIASLRSGDERFARRSTAVMGQMGENALEAVPELMKVMREGGPVPWREVGEAIRTIGRDANIYRWPQLPVPSVTDALKDGRAEVRRHAAWTIGLLEGLGHWAEPALVEALDDTDRDVRIEAALSLVKMFSGEARARVVLIETAMAPGDWNPLDVPRHDEPDVALSTLTRALTLSTRWGSPVGEDVSGLLGVGYDPLRIWALGQIGRGGRKHEALAPRLVPMLEDANPSVRQEAATALGRIESGEKPVLEALSKALGDTNPKVRSAAAGALGVIGPLAAAYAPDLVGVLDDPDMSVVHAAFSAIESIGAGASDFLDELLVRALAERPGHEEGPASKALWGVDPQGLAVIPRLLDLLSEEASKEGAKRILMMIGPNARPVLPVLVSALEDAEQPARETVALAIGKMGAGARSALPALLAASNDPDPVVAKAAAGAMGAVGFKKR